MWFSANPAGLLFTEDGDDVFDGYDEEAVVAFKNDGDGFFGVEKDAIVLADGVIVVVFDLHADGDDSAGEGGDFNFVGEVDAGFGLLFVLVLANENAWTDRFDGFELRLRLG